MDVPVCAFVMAGGSGERFWPMSRQRTPKHLLRLLDERTLLETTVSRLDGIVPLERTFVLTNAAQIDATRAAVPGLPAANIVAEPAKRDTAPACALATALARRVSPDAVAVVLPADAMIHDVDRFRRQLADAISAASETGGIATLGIPPTHPATGFGYLETGRDLAAGPNGSLVRQLVRFVEKPDLETAQRYFEEGHFYWNAGIFVWRTATFLEEAERQQPALAKFISAFPKSGDFAGFLSETFPLLPKISVDYAIMENADSVVAVLAEFDWDDVGAWTALPTHLGRDPRGNTFRGSVVEHASESNIAISNGRQIALCGVRDLVVVETPDAILVCHRDAVQHVKNLQPNLPEALK
ncbi:MAG: sugar phosphate nucleotidyltransferase [Terrimicrobiaceae bacterium]|nr:sugar phosphate nucleotidyltransferase [Terrimicrobiaceae bacterium]